MKRNVKNLTFLSLLMLIGCASNKNIVTDIDINRAVLRDAKTGKKRVYDYSTNDTIKSTMIWLAPGDTVRLESDYYARGTLFTPKNSHLICNWTELQNRKTEFEKEKLRQEINMNYPKTK